MKRGIGIQTLKATSPVVIGDWSRDTVRLDFDNTPLETVKYWAYWAMSYFHLGGFIVLESSRSNRTFKKPNFHLVKTSYLVVFDRKVKWDLNVKVMAWVSLRSHIESLKDYVIMQCVKGSSTVRLSPKENKPSPKVVFRYGSQEGQIAKFLETRNFIKDFETKNRK